MQKDCTAFGLYSLFRVRVQITERVGTLSPDSFLVMIV